MPTSIGARAGNCWTQQIDPEAEIGRKYVDKLLKVRLKSGGEQWVLVHVEVQMAADEKFTWRMYVYNYRIFDKYEDRVSRRNHSLCKGEAHAFRFRIGGNQF